MKYRDMIQRVQDYSGFSDKESETALTAFVKTLAARLQSGERSDFASQLPADLKDKAMAADTADFKGDRTDFYIMFQEMEGETIDEPRMKKQIIASWKALKDSLTAGQIGHIKDQMPKDLAIELN